MDKKERNYKRYNIAAAAPFEGVTVAESENWFYKVRLFPDNSGCLEYIAKPGTGCASGYFCGLDMLHHHLQRIKSINANGIGWTVSKPEFFEAMGISNF